MKLAQIVHCDLKAANILSTKNGNIKLTDFGVSLNMTAKQGSGTQKIVGTPYWSTSSRCHLSQGIES